MTIHSSILDNCFACLGGLIRDESGQDLIEYALVAALVAVGAVATLKTLSTKLTTLLTTISSGLSSAI